MTKVSIDDIRHLQDADVGQHLIVCDKTGRVLGHYLPTELYDRLICQSASAHVSTEELRQRLSEPDGRELTEIWERLARS